MNMLGIINLTLVFAVVVTVLYLCINLVEGKKKWIVIVRGSRCSPWLSILYQWAHLDCLRTGAEDEHYFFHCKTVIIVYLIVFKIKPQAYLHPLKGIVKGGMWFLPFVMGFLCVRIVEIIRTPLVPERVNARRSICHNLLLKSPDLQVHLTAVFLSNAKSIWEFDFWNNIKCLQNSPQ